MLRQGRIVNRRFIYNYIYGYNSSAVDEKTVDVMMCKGTQEAPRLLRRRGLYSDLPGQGYRFSPIPNACVRRGRFVVVAYEEQTADEADSVKSAA